MDVKHGAVAISRTIPGVSIIFDVRANVSAVNATVNVTNAEPELGDFLTHRELKEKY